jgi:multicomponent Na+:H+ antiporter subunit G
MDVLGGVLLVAGAVFVLLAGVGVVRFDDVFPRMHAAAKGPTLGLLLIGLGVVVSVRTVDAVVTVILVVILQLIAGPVGTHVIGRSTYRRVDSDFETDELGDSED